MTGRREPSATGVGVIEVASFEGDVEMRAAGAARTREKGIVEGAMMVLV